MTLPFHGLGGVKKNVDEDLLELMAVSADQRILIGQDRSNHHIPEDLLGSHQSDSVFDKLVNTQILHLGIPGTGELKETADDPLDPLRLLLNIAEILLGLGIFLFPQEDGGVTQNSREGVADLVGDPGRQLPHRGKLFHPHHLPLGGHELPVGVLDGSQVLVLFIDRCLNPLCHGVENRGESLDLPGPLNLDPRVVFSCRQSLSPSGDANYGAYGHHPDEPPSEQDDHEAIYTGEGVNELTVEVQNNPQIFQGIGDRKSTHQDPILEHGSGKSP